MANKVLDELAQWIDTSTIAQAVLEELKEQDCQQTVENGQKIWLDFLENELPDGLRSSVKYRYDVH